MKKILFYLFFLSFVVSYSQQEASYWYFGENAGIQFDINNETITPLNDGQLNTREGCVSISDTNGDLLFYSDGSTVYTSTHTVMVNGTGLLGDDSSTQSAIVVPKPNTPNIYYIFTVGSNQSNDGLKYSVVNMSLNDGLGEVISKNNNLLNGCSEKVTAIAKDCDSDEIWVIALSDLSGNSNNTFNTFHAFEVTTGGINTTSITSTFNNIIITDSRGYLKLSPDGTKLACANVQSGLFLFDFDTQTGIVSNDIALNIISNTGNNKPYGVEFSPDSQFLYVTSSNDFFDGGNQDQNPSSHSSRLVQFNLSIDDQNINGSQFLIDERELYRGGLQLGPDGKIYRALSSTYNDGSPFLGVINSPNESHLACDYMHNALSLGNNNSTQGLPPFISSFFNANIDIIHNGSSSTYLPLCEGETYTLIAEDIPGATYEWTFDGQVIAEDDFDLIINESGTYEVFIDLSTGDCNTLEGEAVVEYFQNPEAFNATLIQCDDDTDGFTLFNLDEAYNDLTGGTADVYTKFYTSLFDAQNEENEIADVEFFNSTNPQIIYTLVIDNVSGCNTMSELTLEVNVIQISNYQVEPVCDELNSEDGFNTFNLDDIATQILIGLPTGLTVSFYNTYNDALLEQNELSSPYSNTTPYSQFLYTRFENENDCFGISEIELTINELPQLLEDDTQLYCLNFHPEYLTIDVGIVNDNPNNYTYSWSSGQDTFEIQINETGAYTVTVTNINGCSSERTIIIQPSNIATFESIEVVDGSQNNNVTIIVSGEGSYIYSIHNEDGMHTPFQSSNVFNNIPPGIYTVEVRDIKNECGIVENLISVIGFPQFFTPNNDGYNDTWVVKGISSQFQPNSKILIFDRFGKLLKQLNPTGEGWDGTYNGKALPNNDYWFAVTLQDGRVYKSHFTLKR